jgi:hypothetical protein
MNRALLFSALTLFSSALRAQELGTFTLLEGSVRVLRGTAVLRGVEGMRFQSGDIVETGTPGFVQAEFSGGSIAAIGQATRVWIHGGGATRNMVLMSGWVKGETSPSGGAYRFVGPLLTASAKGGAVIVHASPGVAEVYVESGSATVSEAESGAGKTVAAKAGQFLTRHAGKNVAVATRPDGAFVDAMPRPFRDTLPPRISRFAGKKAPEPKMDHEIAYAEAEPWLKLGHGWRRTFSERFQPRLKDVEFRKLVEQHIAEYPEWDRVLHPEKYENSPSAPNAASTPPPGNY